MNIKTTIAIIAISVSSISMSEAGQNRHDETRSLYSYQQTEGYNKERHNGHEKRHKHWKHASNHRIDRFQGKRHSYSRHNKHSKCHNRKHSHWNRGWREDRRAQRERRRDRDSRYRHNRQHSSHTVVVNADPLVPIIVASKIAKKVVRHDSIIRNIIRHDPIARAIFGH